MKVTAVDVRKRVFSKEVGYRVEYQVVRQDGEKRWTVYTPFKGGSEAEADKVMKELKGKTFEIGRADKEANDYKPPVQEKAKKEEVTAPPEMAVRKETKRRLPEEPVILKSDADDLEESIDKEMGGFNAKGDKVADKIPS